jgi:hypothetical protein
MGTHALGGFPASVTPEEAWAWPVAVGSEDGVSVADCYEVEEISGSSLWLRCRHCGHTWKLFDGKSWRCPLEADHN